MTVKPITASIIFVALAALAALAHPAPAAVVPFVRNQPIAPAVSPGQKPDSPFGVNSYNEENRVRFTAMGVKWFREMDPQPAEKEQAMGYNELIMQLLIPGEMGGDRDKEAINANDQFSAPKPEAVDGIIARCIGLLRKNPQIHYVEFYNEHWWMYSGASMDRFRADLRAYYTAIKKFNPNIVVLTGNDMSAVTDDIAVNGGARYLDGFAPHLYAGTNALSFLDEPAWRRADWSYQLTLKYQKKYQWLTEGGEMHPPASAPPGAVNAMAYKLVQRYSTYPFLGIQKTFAFMHDDAWSSPELYKAYAVMTTVMEDKHPVTQLWPRSMLTWASLFEEPGQSLAVVWSLAGSDPLHNDAGQMEIHGAQDIAAYDVFGQPAGSYDQATATLTVPVGNGPTYLLSPMSAGDLAAHLQDSVQLTQPVKGMIEPLTAPPGPTTPLAVRLYNGGTLAQTGTLDIAIPSWSVSHATPFRVEAGRFALVPVTVTAAAPNPGNLYVASLTINTDGGLPLTTTQALQAAFMVRKTPKIDGALDEWQNETPVTLASTPDGGDAMYAALHPLVTTDAQNNVTNSVIRLWSAYDNDNLYIAYEVKGKQTRGQFIQLALGLTNWSTHNMRKQDDPWAYKGYFVDSDYLFAINAPAGQVWRLAAPGVEFRSPYNWFIANKGGGPDKNPRFVSDLAYDDKVFFDLVPHGASIETGVEPDGSQTVECAIPRKFIPEFKPESGKPIRMSFTFHHAADVESDPGKTQWSQAAGEFNFMQGYGSFIPSWTTHYDNQLQWGVAAGPSRR